MADFRHFFTVNKSRNLHQAKDRKARKNSFMERSSPFRQISCDPIQRELRAASCDFAAIGKRAGLRQIYRNLRSRTVAFMVEIAA
jgi:hypothetical protein